jgi:hypothetical protein
MIEWIGFYGNKMDVKLSHSLQRMSTSYIALGM